MNWFKITAIILVCIAVILIAAAIGSAVFLNNYLIFGICVFAIIGCLLLAAGFSSAGNEKEYNKKNPEFYEYQYQYQ